MGTSVRNREAAINQYMSGTGIADIAETHGVSPAIVREWVEDNPRVVSLHQHITDSAQDLKSPEELRDSLETNLLRVTNSLVNSIGIDMSCAESQETKMDTYARTAKALSSLQTAFFPASANKIAVFNGSTPEGLASFRDSLRQ